MTAFTLASWNINSVRLRAPLVADWVSQADPDVLCLQEIKCLNEQFPEEAFREMGFRHFHVRGQKGMHGVAIASNSRWRIWAMKTCARRRKPVTSG